MKALPIYVLKNDSFKGCSNNGISEKFDSLLLIHDEGFINIDKNDLPENLVKVVTREMFNGEFYTHLEPYQSVPKGKIGYMSGGSFGYTSDSRFSKISKYPLSIHDRTE